MVNLLRLLTELKGPLSMNPSVKKWNWKAVTIQENIVLANLEKRILGLCFLSGSLAAGADAKMHEC